MLDTRRPLYPLIAPYTTGRLRVTALHDLYYEECGNPAGKPVLVLHGGPGAGISAFMRQGHDPAKYRMILFDQRGCGRSTPYASLADNTTWDLVEDIERLRDHLGIDRWQVVGGSWGSTLALAYAVTHPARVTEMVLRGIFTLRQAEIDWFYQAGASMIFPDAYAKYVSPIPEDERGDLVPAFYRRLTGNDPDARRDCARAWAVWEATTLSLLPNPAREADFGDDHFAAAFAAIECHYFVNKGFFAHDGWLLDQAHTLRGIPGTIIHGRYDVVTPIDTAFLLANAWPDADLRVIPDAGHTGVEPGIADAVVRATDLYANRNWRK